MSGDNLQPSEKKAGGFFNRLARTRENFSSKIQQLFTSRTAVDESFYEDLEDQLIMADVGVHTSQEVVTRLRAKVKAERIDAEAVHDALKQVMVSLFPTLNNDEVTLIEGDSKLKVIMVVGVNGVGKTTTIAKMANRYKSQGKQVMLAACDTFRAAAIEQLKDWGDRMNIPVVAQQHGSDAAAVAYDAYTSASSRNCDILIIDTAGRQHTHQDLMAQLGKVKRVLEKIDPSLPHETLMVVDAGNGQNVMSQVQHFNEAVPLTGLCITKLDGTAKGGIVFSLAHQYGIQIRYVGVGEAMEDLRLFDAGAFVDALFDNQS